MRHLTIKHVVVIGIVSAVILTFSNTAYATPVSAGLDYFESLPGTEVDLSGFGLGIVPLEGVPFLEDINGDLNIDTIVARNQGLGSPFDPPGDSGLVDIEIVALSLVSVAPVDLTPLGGPFIGLFSDLFTTINKGGIIPGLAQPDALNPSIGRMEIRHDTGPLPTDDIGGSFDSAFAQPGDGLPVPPGLLVAGGGVFADAIFTVVGGDPGNPLDVLFSLAAPRVVLSSVDSTWEHLSGVTDFQVTAINHDGPHPVIPRVRPEPTTLSLLAFGGLMLARRRRRC